MCIKFCEGLLWCYEFWWLMNYFFVFLKRSKISVKKYGVFEVNKCE